jgi:hypothetical protein
MAASYRSHMVPSPIAVVRKWRESGTSAPGYRRAAVGWMAHSGMSDAHASYPFPTMRGATGINLPLLAVLPQVWRPSDSLGSRSAYTHDGLRLFQQHR